MTIHLQASESVSEKILSFLESLSKQGEKIEIIDDAVYKFEKEGILKGLQQIEEGKTYTSDELLKELDE